MRIGFTDSLSTDFCDLIYFLSVKRENSAFRSSSNAQAGIPFGKKRGNKKADLKVDRLNVGRAHLLPESKSLRLSIYRDRGGCQKFFLKRLNKTPVTFLKPFFESVTDRKAHVISCRRKLHPFLTEERNRQRRERESPWVKRF